ncbi:YchF family ATPase, partial [Myxococcota bacterium]|nr:YchF family ATPase [Myxococcota bacterium]
MKIGIVGFAGSGKTTLFNALTGQDQPTGFGGGKVNLGRISVPDARLERLVELNNPRSTVYAEITFADVPGGRGEQSLDPQTLGRIREMDALAQVLRGFDEGMGDPEPDVELASFEAELLLADLQVLEKRIARLKKDRSDPNLLGLLERCQAWLESDQPLRGMALSEPELASITPYAFLTLKPRLLVLNLGEDQAPEAPEALTKAAEALGLELLTMRTAMEAEIAALEPEDQAEFLAEMGLEAPAADRFIRSAYGLLNLITFFTQGADECRAWPLRRDSNAVLAAGVIHSDIARGFIRAEVVTFDDMDRFGTEAKVKEVGRFRVEGRDYIVQDGDICHFRF